MLERKKVLMIEYEIYTHQAHNGKWLGFFTKGNEKGFFPILDNAPAQASNLLPTLAFDTSEEAVNAVEQYIYKKVDKL